jgi:hypothetical protein
VNVTYTVNQKPCSGCDANPPDYTWFGLHSNAKLTSAERADLIKGLEATFGPPAPDRKR